MNLLKEKSSHWYRVKDDVCSPCHEWPKADGKGMKRTTLREARLNNLFPSVTNIIDGVIAKPELERWKITQALMAALTLPRNPGESEDAFALRVVDDMDAYSGEAKDFGTLCHDHIEHYISHGEVLDNEAAPFTDGARRWIVENVNKIHGTELTVYHPTLCYAGRLDLDGEVKRYGPALIDFKTQKVRKKPNGEWNPIFYDEFPVQLAAYMACLPTPRTLISVIIGSEEPAPAFVKVYTEVEFYLRLFKHALDWWCYKKNYDPRLKPMQRAKGV